MRFFDKEGRIGYHSNLLDNHKDRQDSLHTKLPDALVEEHHKISGEHAVDKLQFLLPRWQNQRNNYWNHTKSPTNAMLQSFPHIAYCWLPILLTNRHNHSQRKSVFSIPTTFGSGNSSVKKDIQKHHSKNDNQKCIRNQRRFGPA